MKKAAPILLILLLVIVLLMIRNFEQVRSSRGKQKIQFNRNQQLQYTAHAKCRMKCRGISHKDVELILKEGQVNNDKSDLTDKPCPVFALQGKTYDDEHVRIIYAQCDSITKVVTVINLEREMECHCPGDKKKESR